MPLPRLARALALGSVLLALTATAAAADPPWSTPAPLPGAGNGPATVTGRGNVAAVVTSNRTQPPNTASQLLRLDPTTGSVLSRTPLDLAGVTVAAYAGDSIAVAGTSIGPSARSATRGATSRSRRAGCARGSSTCAARARPRR